LGCLSTELEKQRPFEFTENVIKSLEGEEKQQEIDQNSTKRERGEKGEIKEDMGGIYSGDWLEDAEKYVWLSFVDVDYG